MKYEEYYNLKNQYHRIDGPAIVEYYENGNIKHEFYYVGNKLNKLDGPAVVRYNKNNEIVNEEYYINGKKLSEKQFLKLSKTLQSNIIS